MSGFAPVRTDSMLGAVRFSIPGFHYWPEATGNRFYLAQYHRHLFHVEVKISLLHNDREVEFHDLLDFCKEHFVGGDLGMQSCEMMAESLGKGVKQKYADRFVEVSVYEDGEVGAIWRSG